MAPHLRELETGGEHAVVALRQGVHDGWADVDGDRPHAAIAKGKLTDAGMITAKLRAETIGRPKSQRVESAGRAARECEDVPVVDAPVALRVAIAELVDSDVLLAEEERVTQPIRDVAEPGHRFLWAQN